MIGYQNKRKLLVYLSTPTVNYLHNDEKKKRFAAAKEKYQAIVFYGLLVMHKI